jgi:cell division protein FtsW (lipid II flippase)
MFFAMFVGMLYVSTGRGSWLLIGAVFTVIGVVAAWKLFPNFTNRVHIWLHPFDQSLYTREIGSTYQLVQGLFGLSSGGLFGTGLGQGHPGITPFANSDFIYTSLGEELGLVGLFAILLLYLTIITVGFWAAVRVSDGFGKLMAAGLMFSMAFQIFTVVGGITLVIPLTGLTLPFMAAGGSSLIANWILAMLVLIISDASWEKDDQLLVTDPALRAEAIAKSRQKAAAEKAEKAKAQKDRRDGTAGRTDTEERQARG